MTALSVEAVEQQIAQDQAYIEKLNTRIKSLRDLLSLLKDSALPIIDDKAATIEITRKTDFSCVTPTTPATVSVDSGAKRGRKPKGEYSLANLILLAIADKPEGLTSSEIIRSVLNMGYKTASDDFQRVVGSTLSSLKAKNRLVRDESGRYRSLENKHETEFES